MKSLEDIKNDYAVSKGYKSWFNLLSSALPHTTKNRYINEVMILTQKECLKRASENIDDIPYLHERITNENNIIK